MNIQSRAYRDDADLVRMRQLVMIGQQANIPASYMHPGCLDWATQGPPADHAMPLNLRLWESLDHDESLPDLVAWAIFAHNEGSFDLFVHPTLHGTPLHETVMAEYIAWAEARARELGLKQLWPFWAMAYDHVLERLLQTHGFVNVQTGPPAPLFERLLNDLPLLHLPAGYVVQSVVDFDAGRLRASVTFAAFKSTLPWETYAADYAGFMNSAVYDGERDVLIRAPDGRAASTCTIWFDPSNHIGLFEPVATHPDFQGRGLGKAVMAEGLRRMKSAGMQQAIVGFDPNNLAALRLYTSMGFRASNYFMFPQKAL